MAFNETINTGVTGNDGTGAGLRTNMNKLIENDNYLKSLMFEKTGGIVTGVIEIASSSFKPMILRSLGLSTQALRFLNDVGGWDVIGPAGDGSCFRIRSLLQDNSIKKEDLFVIDWGSGKIGIGTRDPNESLEVIGNIKCVSLIQTSDKKFKTNIEPIDGEWALEIFKKLKFSFYDFSLSNSKRTGLIAQEVEKILPQAVHTAENGEKGLDYNYIDIVCKAAIQYFIKSQIQ